jgi:hypothetical protein
MHCGKSGGAQAPGKTCPLPLPGPDQPRGQARGWLPQCSQKIETGREPHRQSCVARGRVRGFWNAKVYIWHMDGLGIKAEGGVAHAAVPNDWHIIMS